MELSYFTTQPFISALKTFFAALKVPVNYFADEPAKAQDILGALFKANNPTYQLIDEVYVLGLVDDAAFPNKDTHSEENWTTERVKNLNKDYDGLLIFGITLFSRPDKLLPTRGQLAEITRVFNQAFPHTPVTVVFKYDGRDVACNVSTPKIAFANTERLKFKQGWREGEKTGKVTMLKDIDVEKTHAAHLRILFGDKNSNGLSIDNSAIDKFSKLYKYWQTVFSLQALNDQFYKDLQAWFYYATQKIKLPFKPDYINEKENIKNFLVRLLARTMFCWFVKEKGLIKLGLLELTDWEGNKYKLTNDVDDEDFLQRNSYYRGVLQNVFYNALNQKEKNSAKDFKWTKYLHSGFQIEWLTQIPYLNGGIFDKLEEDNAKESIEDSVISIPNYLFYGIETDETVTKGKGAKATKVVEKVEHKGLNGILKSYKFTLDENTPFEEDIALDPEMLGLVFENLLAELDPNLEESTINSIRKMTGSFYTPRKTIYEMVNDSLFLYLTKFLQKNYPKIEGIKKQVSDLVYFNQLVVQNSLFCQAVVHALDQFKMLDPACGSGAFPMGILHRMVDILKLVDADNQLWLDIKLRGVDIAQRGEFKKMLNLHLDDYSRKLGVIRDSIYGIDIQPLAVQITKLRFFISLLIDQKTEKGITPMPNIETKIICADSLKNIEADLFSKEVIGVLTEARTRYYQPDISQDEREEIAVKIVDKLDQAFPSFAFQITGKRIPGQNKALIKEWFKHSTLAAPFFNMDFFFPELIQSGGFDCVIGNPPYGGIKITDEVRNALGIESKDPYGAFIARFLNSADKPTPLKHGGVLAYIVSDTFMTIKSHLPLRRMMMQNYIHKMLRMHPDTFRATVNTVIMVAERNAPGGRDVACNVSTKIDDNHICLMADMTNISIHENYDRFIEILEKTKIDGSFSCVDSGTNVASGSSDLSGRDVACNVSTTTETVTEPATVFTNESTPEYAIYRYPQSLIRTNSNLPFFVASPKLQAFQNDSTRKNNIEGNEPKIYFLGSEMRLFKIGETYTGTGQNKNWKNDGLFKVISGVKTGSNSKYLLENVPFSEILSDEDAINLNQTDKENGIKGKQYFVSFEMGKSSDTDIGVLPCYFQEPDNVYVNWSTSGVTGMKNEAHSDLANKEFRFIPLKNQISFSTTGQYAPTFRISHGLIFLNKASRLFVNYNIDQLNWIGILNSKLFKYFSSNFSNHTVEFGIEDLKSILFKKDIFSCKDLVESIIFNQKSNQRYDYASHEQIEIDKLVYEAYGLNPEDVEEVENWYARRYSKLIAAQKANLRALGKSDDYLVLYGMK